ncbi:hypothetical protein JCM5350_004558 [Sporobolomyces pararoseus]
MPRAITKSVAICKVPYGELKVLIWTNVEKWGEDRLYSPGFTPREWADDFLESIPEEVWDRQPPKAQQSAMDLLKSPAISLDIHSAAFEKELAAWTESFKTVLEDPVWCKVDLQALFTRLAGQLRLLYLRPEVLDNLERLVREVSEYWHRLSIDSKRKCVAAFNACVIMSRFLSDTLYETRLAQRAWSFYYVHVTQSRRAHDDDGFPTALLNAHTDGLEGELQHHPLNTPKDVQVAIGWVCLAYSLGPSYQETDEVALSKDGKILPFDVGSAAHKAICWVVSIFSNQHGATRSLICWLLQDLLQLSVIKALPHYSQLPHDLEQLQKLRADACIRTLPGTSHVQPAWTEW